MSRNDVGVIAVGAVLLFMFMASGTGCGGGGGSTPKTTPTPIPSAFKVCAPEGGSCDNPATVAIGASQQFQAQLTGTGTLPALNWSVNGVQGGTAANGMISNSGLYTAPSAFPSGKSVTITATDQTRANNFASASGVIVDNTKSQLIPIKLGTTGGNSTDQVTVGTTTTCCSGTLGSLIQRGGNFFILSNNHVLAKSDQGAINDPVTQPGLVDNNCNAGTVVAHLSQIVPLKPSPCVGVCTGPAPNNVDAALAQIVVGAVDTSGNILDLAATGGPDIPAAPPSINVAVPSTVIGSSEGVAKVGRATGLTCSSLSSINTTVSVGYSATCGGATAFTSTYTNQLVINGGSFSASGDSGSLVLTSDTARPLGLLYGGNDTTSTANPIQDVLTALGGGPVFVGGGDHAVQCTVVANSAIITVPASAEQSQHAIAVRDRHMAELARDPAVTAVTVGSSKDFPGEAVIVVHANGVLAHPLAAQIEGVTTQTVFGGQTAFTLLASDMDRTTAVKEAHVASLMEQPGVYGVGVGRSDNDASATALVIYIEPGYINGRAEIPSQIDGERVKIIEGEHFRAFNWGHETIPQHACVAKSATKKR